MCQKNGTFSSARIMVMGIGCGSRRSIAATCVFMGICALHGSVVCRIVFAWGCLSFFAVFYIPMYYINGRIGILQDSIVVVTGVFIERTRYQIRSQISSAAVLDNPISFLFSLSTLILYAPGSTVVIPLLDRKKAYEISEMLQKSK